jgi:hypothetical protein
MSKETVKVVEIDTNPAVKSLKDLRKELLGYKNEMANLEEGSDAFLEVANKAGELKHQIDEINESIKGASADFGDMLGNVTNVTAGLTGAFQAVAGGLQAIGVESEAVDKAILKMQGLMAVTQGLGAIDDGIKSWDKLTKAISSSSSAMKAFKVISNPVAILGIGTAVVAIVNIWNKWGDTIRKNIPILDEWIKKIDGTTAKEKELLEERQSAWEEYFTTITEKANAITSKRELEDITDDARKKIERLRDDIVLYEKQVADLDNLKNQNKDNRSIWEEYDAQADKLVNETIPNVKREIEDLLTNPKYKISNQPKSNTTTFEKPEALTELIAKSPEALTVPIKPTVSVDEMKEAVKNAIEKGLEKLEEDDYNSIEEKVRRLGDKMFETLEATTLAFSESSLGITSGWVQSLVEFQEVFNMTMDVIKNDGKNTWNDYANIAVTALAGVGTMLNALSNEQDASDKEGFERTKKLQIAATVMNMLSGIMAAWTSAMTPANAWMTLPGQIAMGTATSAMIGAIGGMQIDKIKSQTMQSANPNTNINAKSVNTILMPPVQYSSAVQGANTEGAIKNQKVVVLESDIVDTVNKVSVQESENTY